MKKALAIASALFLGAALASPAAHAQWSGIDGKQGGESRERASDVGRQDPRGRDDGKLDGQQGDRSSEAGQAYPGGDNAPYAGQRGGPAGGDAQYGSQQGGRDPVQFGGGRGGRNDNPYGGRNDDRYGSGHGRDNNRWDGNRNGGRDNNQWDNNRHGGRDNNQWDNNRHGGRDYNHWDNNRYGGRNDHRYSRYYSPHRYRSSFAYVQPYGYRYSRWDVGAYLPYGYYGRSYYVDYRPYGLALPPRGFQWVRVDRDVYLVSIYDGLVRDILYDLFY